MRKAPGSVQSADAHLERRERLRRAKRAQRDRDREAGLLLCQVKLRPATAEKLRRALAIPGFEETLARLLDDAVVDVDAYPNLRLLCWNRVGRFITAREAFSLYERNWRLVDERALDAKERALIERLVTVYGGGLLNV